jgi:hypothetical protein
MIEIEGRLVGMPLAHWIQYEKSAPFQVRLYYGPKKLEQMVFQNKQI